MTTQDDALRASNVARAQAMLDDFKPLTDAWLAGLHDDLVMEFPFGADVGLPPRIEGKTICSGLFQAVVHKLGLRFAGIQVYGMADPNLVLAEYRGHGAFNGKPYEQRYITLLRFADGRLILYREYVDSKIVENVIGHLSALSG